jgi:AraC-like DNA-binding protein
MTTSDASPEAARQPFRFSSLDFPSPQDAFARLRNLTADICETSVLGEVTHFHVTSSTMHLGGGVLMEVRSSALGYDRTPEHVARGLDSFQLTLYSAGGVEFFAADRAFLQRAGDVCLIDMAQPNEARVMTAADGVAHGISFMLPRMLLAPFFPAANAIPPIAIVPRESAYAGLLTDLMRSLQRSAPNLDQGENQAALQALAQLAAVGASRHVETDATLTDLSQEALRARIKHYIEDNLAQAALGVEALCRGFDVSRAGLYRLFAPQSPASYIQERRLHRGFAMLMSPAFRSWRILDVAMECRFSSDGAFIRAFRRQFGVTPGEAREFADQKFTGAPPGKVAPLAEPDAEAIRWLMQLTGAMPVGARALPE